MAKSMKKKMPVPPMTKSARPVAKGKALPAMRKTEPKIAKAKGKR